MKKIEKDQLSVLIDEELLKEFKTIAKADHKFVSGAIEEAIELWLQENKKDYIKDES